MTNRPIDPPRFDHAFLAADGAYGMEGCLCGWRRDGWDAPPFEAHLLLALADADMTEMVSEFIDAERPATHTTQDVRNWLRAMAFAGPRSSAYSDGRDLTPEANLQVVDDRCCDHNATWHSEQDAICTMYGCLCGGWRSS